MVVYARFADDDDTMLWLRFRARKRFRRQHLSIAQHRRWVAATGLCIGGGQGPCGRKRRELAHFSWEDHLLRLTEAEFKLRYRLNFDSFMDLLHILRADLVVSNEKQARFAKWGQLVMPEVKLAMALRFLAGGSPLDLKLMVVARLRMCASRGASPLGADSFLRAGYDPIPPLHVGLDGDPSFSFCLAVVGRWHFRSSLTPCSRDIVHYRVMHVSSGARFVSLFVRPPVPPCVWLCTQGRSGPA